LTNGSILTIRIATYKPSSKAYTKHTMGINSHRKTSINKDISDKEQEEFNALMNRLFMIEALPMQTSINEIKKKQ
jgi:hypothetical protein